MASTQLLAPGGGIAAGTPFVVGTFLQVTNVTPPQAATANVVQESGFIGVPGPARGDVTNLNRAIGIGLDLQEYTANITGTNRQPVIIGYQAGYVAAGVPGSGVAIGNGARTDGNSVCIGLSTTVNASAGTSINVVIASTAVTNANCTGVIAIGCGGGTIASSRGTYLGARNTVNVGDGCAIGVDGSGPDIQGAGGIAIGNGTTIVSGTDGIAIGRSATAAANAIALGASAVAAAGICMIGSTASVKQLDVIPAAAGVGFRIDASAVADEIRMLVWDVTGASLKRVSRGAADSGGVGFRLLRIPN